MNDATLNFVDSGKGKITLLFLHYFGGSSNSWRHVIAYLEKQFRCIAVDLRGFGNSPATDKYLSINDNAGDVVSLINMLQLKDYVLIGHSMGGKIALAVAAQIPAGLRSLILIAPSPPTPEPTSQADRIHLQHAFRDRAAIKTLVDKITVLPLEENDLEEIIQTHFEISEAAWNGWIEKGSREDISSLMKNIDVPVSIMSGSSDPNFSTEFLRTEFLQYFPKAFFEEIQGGHLLPIEAAAEVAKSIEKFL